MRWLGAALALAMTSSPAIAQELFEFQQHTSHWTSPETRDAPRGQRGPENQGAKGHPYDTIRAGESLVLANIQGSGIIRRIWITVENRTPVMLRSLRLEMYDHDRSDGSIDVREAAGANTGAAARQRWIA